MHLNTLKTVVGFCREFVEKHTPLKRRCAALADIYNYLDIAGLYATSGQPSEAQFQLIHDAGYQTVINLAPNSILENAVVNEREILARLGMEYIHIPVNFQQPGNKKYQAFVSTLEQNSDKKIWVHCAANMRVSAFTYRYRRSVLGVDDGIAKADLRKIWEPIGVWKKFIQR